MKAKLVFLYILFFSNLKIFAAPGDASLPTLVMPDGCQKQVIFLPQAHRSVVGPSGSNEISEEISRSQYSIAKFITRAPKQAVFSEQVDEDISSSQIVGDLEKLAEQLKVLFLRGLPQSYDELTVPQKKELGRIGADGFLLLTGKIQDLHKVVPNRATQDALFMKIQSLMKTRGPFETVPVNSELMNLITTVREKMALAEIKQYFEKNSRERSVVLIYGKLHDFKKYDDIFPGKCVVIPKEFTTK